MNYYGFWINEELENYRDGIGINIWEDGTRY